MPQFNQKISSIPLNIDYDYINDDNDAKQILTLNEM
jgi:hypothetical protein